MKAPTNGYILDANFLLNFSFVANSFSQRVVSLAQNKKIPLLTCPQAIDESRARLSRLERKFSIKSGHLHYRFAVLLNESKVRSVSSPSGSGPPVSGHDQHISDCAKHTGGCVLTTDSKLYMELSEHGLKCEFPIGALHDLGASRNAICFGLPFSPKTGSIFSRVHMRVNWSHRSRGRRYIADFPGFVAIFFDEERREWCAKFDSGKQLSIKQMPRIEADDDLHTVSLSWSERGEAIFRANDVQHATLPYKHSLFEALVGPEVPIGHSRSRNSHLNGSIYCLVWHDKPISKRFWKRSLNGAKSICPNPFDDDRLEGAIKKLIKR